MTFHPPLPKRIAWFTPWRWKPWKLWVMFGVVLAGYVEAFVLLEILNQHPECSLPWIVDRYVSTMWFPLKSACEHSPGVALFYDVQIGICETAIDFLFGEP